MIAKNKTKTYNLYIWIQDTGAPQNELQGKSFSAKINVKGNQNKANTLASKILGENNANVISSTPTFSTTSTDKGIFVQNSDSTKSNYGFSTYYYRGAVENNYVQLGTYKSNVINDVYDSSSYSNSNQVVAQAGDPILWRIVRINEDGSIRLIAEHNTGLFVPYDSTSPYSKDYKGSDIETEVNNWYNTNIAVDSNIDNLIITGVYCNEISIAVGTRMENKTPIFTCPSGANIINSKVGSISADEMLYAGALYLESLVNNTTYLNNNTYFWTISPLFNWDVSADCVDVNADHIYDRFGVRPVINLKSDVTVSSGTGTSTDPYIIK